jgi:hypothetical protein
MDNPPDPTPTAILRDQRDPDGSRYLDATLGADGRLLIEGQDVGAGVERVFGDGIREYEWSWTVRPASVPAAVAALDGAPHEPPLAVVARWSAAHEGVDPGSALKKAGVPIEFWSRAGD